MEDFETGEVIISMIKKTTTKKLIETAIKLIEVLNDQWFDKVTIKLSKLTAFHYFYFSSFSFRFVFQELCITSIEYPATTKFAPFQRNVENLTGNTHSRKVIS